jgi:hypothetical protein
MSNRGNQGKAPTMATFVICLLAYLLALASHFGWIRIDPRIGTYAWIGGFALLLLAVRVRGL